MQHTLNRFYGMVAAFVVALCLAAPSMLAQQALVATPQTLNFQAVLHGANNNVLMNTAVGVRLSVVRSADDATPVYTELHAGVTNTNGLVTLEFGNGIPVAGSYAAIDWTKGPYSIRLEADPQGGANYTIIHTTPLLSVPYAMHAQSADRVATFDYSNLTNKPTGVSAFRNDVGYVTRNEAGLGKDGENVQAGVISLTWSLKGNRQINEANDRLGNTDLNPLIFITQDIERMRITADGEVQIANAVLMNRAFTIGGNLEVDESADLNTTGGNTNIQSALTVTNGSATSLTGTLTVDGTTSMNTLDVDGGTTLNNTLGVAQGTTLNGSLDVDGATSMPTTLDVDGGVTLNSALDVDGATTLNNNLDVDGATTLNSTLDVDGATTLNNSLDVDGASTLNNTLDVDGPATVNNSLSVAGHTTLGDLTVEQDLTVNQPFTGHGTNTWMQPFNFDGPVHFGRLDTYFGTTMGSTLDVYGPAYFKLNLQVDGNMSILDSMTLDSAAHFGGTVDLAGDMSMEDALDVDGPATLNSTLDVDGATTLNNTLDVDGATTLNSTLDVDGATTLNSTLDVDGGTTLNSSLDVDGNVHLHDTLRFDVPYTLPDLTVPGPMAVNNTLDITSNQGAFVTTISNTEGSDGDGLLIKLGKTHGAWNGSGYLQIANPATILAGSTLNTVKGWLNGQSFQVADLWTIFPGSMIAGALVQVTNTIIDEINDGLNLPLTLLPEVEVFPGYTLNIPDIPSFTIIPEICVDFGELGEVCTPALEFPGIEIPNVNIPRVTIGPYAIPAIPQIPTGGLPTIAVPDMRGTNVANSLTRENHYMTFQDKAGRQTGAIKAESVSDWRDNTVLDDVYLTKLASSFIGIDLLGAAVTGFSEIVQLIDAHNDMGVAYESGNGDYAEWLERADPNEHITAGDVVGVRGGKISKNIEGAEQTMVVSHKPIVLGNMPQDAKRPYGNDVAFMGQVPVKTMGPVHSGDYIVASGTVKGYAVAKPATSMKLDDYTRVIGRSWQTNAAQGPKMVNTVLGVNNDDWVGSVKQIDTRQTKIEDRVKNLEQKVQSVLGIKLNQAEKVMP